MRLFLALALPEDVRGALAKVQAELRLRCHAKASWAPPENLHVTLKFLGEVRQTEVSNLCQTLGPVHIERPMRLRVAGIDSLPPRGAVSVIAANLSGDVERLCALQEKIETCCGSMGFIRDNRAYVPHVTLARLKSPLNRTQWAAMQTAPPPGPEFDAAGLVLMESQLGSHAPIYRRVAGFGMDA
jgi:2'-5' RNA ligase